ncbi:MFS transporter [Ruegeria arenilitoris]|uniref:MFS transporter n=1 Tax=Ruegeria arenilitoris TaxID=1173585 RepID=UPI00147B2D58|nr:MFS transporter [Ruegeria arenilitoris]
MSLNKQLVTLRSVFVAMASIQLATAAAGTLVPLAFAQSGASQEAASFAASAYSAGFLVGCFVVAKSIADIGHIRAFAAGAAITTAAILLFSQVDSVSFLILLRFLMGLATAGLFSIGDAWINETAEKSSRGRVLAIYAIVVGIVSVLSQAVVILVPEESDDAFVLVALIYCFSTVVIASTRTNPPDPGSKAKVRVRGLLQDAPAAVFGVIAMGMVSTTILSVAPYSASQLGINVHDIAYIIGAIYLGRVLFQYPLGSLSDKVDRRVVIFITSSICAAVLLAMALLADAQPVEIEFDYLSPGYLVLMILMVLLGGSLLTMYSLLTAHAMDRTVPVYVSAAAVTMLFVWTLGSIAGPIITSVFTGFFGDNAMHWVNFAVMSSFVVYLGFHIRSSEPVSHAEQTSHTDLVPSSTEMVPSKKR